MSVSDKTGRKGFSEKSTDGADYKNRSRDSYQALSTSDYAKVIFCDLYYNNDGTVGCRFQITDNVHEDPHDYVGLFRVGYDNLSQCLASKLLCDTVCEEDGKMLRCTFKPSELPELENGFYQFLYVTRESEVCGASMPFQIKNSITKGLCSEDDVVADNSEDDFLVVRSNIAEKNRRLQALLDEMTEKCLKHEGEMRKVLDRFKIVREEKHNLENLLKKANEEKKNISKELCELKEERDTACNEKEDALRILREKNKVFSFMFDDYSEKLKEFTEVKDQLLEEKNFLISETDKLQDQINKLTEDLKSKEAALEAENDRKLSLISNWNKESYGWATKLEDAHELISELENKNDRSMAEITSLNERVAILRQQLKDTKCENLALNTKLTAMSVANEQREDDFKSMKSEVEKTRSEMTALKLHIIELHESKSVPQESKSEKEKIELQILKARFAELETQLKEETDTTSKLKEELVSVNNELAYLTKVKENFQKKTNSLQDALNECILRLDEGSELYKVQFRKIEKLKKKLKSKPEFMVMNSTAASMKDSCSSETCFADETNDVQSSENQNSDSDTGEHVLRQPKIKGLCEVQEALWKFSEIATPVLPNAPASTRIRDVPELQTLIEMNLEKFKNSQPKEDDETMYSIPCPVCEQDVGVYMSSTEELVKHLEIQHKQQVCPICGRLYDMNLPAKYFLFHVEDHFMNEKK